MFMHTKMMTHNVSFHFKTTKLVNNTRKLKFF